MPRCVVDILPVYRNRRPCIYWSPMGLTASSFCW